MHKANNICMTPIAKIITDFPTKFGIPRQGNLIDSIKGRIVFEKEYRDQNALRGLEEYSHLWLIWYFSESDRKQWSPTVRPPRLGGNKRMGIFATRSPFRPNPVGLTCVKIDKIDYDTKDGPVITVIGADLMNNTPIFDIKPYLPHIDAIPDAEGGFASEVHNQKLNVFIPQHIGQELDENTIEQLKALLEQDPRPHYIEDVERVYGFAFKDLEIKFKVNKEDLQVLSVCRQSL